MRHLLYPETECESAYRIDYKKARDAGIRGIIFDIDNTLVPHGAPADENAVRLFEKLRSLKLSACLISNNSEPRVAPFAEAVGAQYVFKAGKPKPGNYRKAMQLMGTEPGSTLFVGDQLFTDVLGANLAGIHTVLVKPIHPKEEIQIVLKRVFERIVLFFYHRKKRPPSDLI